MIFQPFYYPETGCAAYIVGCGGIGKCAVVDGQAKDVERYVALAETKGMAITHAARVGAHYCLHASADVAFEFTPLEDGEEIELGNVRARVLHTPGHTPESVCLLVTDLRRGPKPWFLLTGDTLFVGAVGRPDLPGESERSAAELYESIHSKLLSLPDTLEIYPAHFAGSACGAGMSGKPMSTLAFERLWNPLLGLGRDEFVAAMRAGVPEKPAEMERVMRANRGRA
jgi:hydroxyacylglutathione hydrolase